MRIIREPISVAFCFLLCVFLPASAVSQTPDFDTRGIPAAIKAVAEEENKSPAAVQSKDTVVLEGGGTMTLSIEPAVTVGERANLLILSTSDCHVRVFHFSSDEHATELYPGTTGKSTARPAHQKLTLSWETTHPGGLEHILVYVSEGEILNTAANKGVAAGDFKVFKSSDLFSSRGIPVAIQAKEVHDTPTKTVVAKKFKLLKGRLCYHLKEH